MRNVIIFISIWLFWGLQVVIAQSQSFFSQEGKASYYASKFDGKRTANGETFTNTALTAAHRSLAFNTLVKVTNVRNGKSVVVRINDRGPHINSRIMDISEAAAKEIDMIKSGIATVHIEVVDSEQQLDTIKHTINFLNSPTIKTTSPDPDRKIIFPKHSSRRS